MVRGFRENVKKPLILRVFHEIHGFAGNSRSIGFGKGFGTRNVRKTHFLTTFRTSSKKHHILTVLTTSIGILRGFDTGKSMKNSGFYRKSDLKNSHKTAKTTDFSQKTLIFGKKP